MNVKSQSRAVMRLRQQSSLIETGLMIPLFAVYVAIDIIAAPIWAMSMSLYPIYFLTWQLALASFAVMLYAVGRSILPPLWVIISAWDGLEDGAFYWIQGKPIPASLPWLTSPLVLQPATPTSIYIGTAISAAFLAFIIWKR